MKSDLSTKAEHARRTMEPPWDDLREQRVLGRIAEGRARARRGTSRRRGVIAVAGVAAACVLGLAGWMLWSPGERSTVADDSGAEQAPPTGPDAPADEGAGVVTNPQPAPSSTRARMELADGSRAILSPDARVYVHRQGADRVQLVQKSGEVTYDVTHDPERPFVVEAGHLTVRVRGTRFVVSVQPDFVEVRVEDGRVEVTAPKRQTLLRRGERIRVSRSPAATTAQPTEADGTDTGSAAEPRPARAQPTRSAKPDVAGGRPQRSPPATSGDPEPSADPARDDGTAATLSDRLDAADAARRAGDDDKAAAILHDAIEAHEGEPGIANALFTLARVERNRDDHAAAAEAFARVHRLAPEGLLAQDALAETAASWANAGKTGRAQQTARRYLERYPEGLHANRMRALLQ